MRYIASPRFTLPLCLLLGLFSFENAQADNSLDDWRNEVATIRQLAENDIPRAYEEAQRLQAELPATATPADQVTLLNLLSRIEVFGARTELAAQHIRQAQELSLRHNDRIGRIEADLNLALNAINQGRIEDMVESANDAMSLLEGVDRADLRVEAMLRAAMMYLRLDRINDALKLALQTMEVAKNSEIPKAMMYAHHGLAVMFDQQGSKDKARYHYEQMIEQARIAGSKFWQAFGLFGLGGVLLTSGDVAGGDKLKQEGIELCRNVGAPFCLSQGLFNLASSYQLQNLHEQALPLYDEIVSICESRDNKIALWWTLNARSTSHQELGQLDAAWQDAERSRQLAKEIGVTRYLSMSARRMAAVAAARGEHQRAYRLSVEAADLKGKMEREQSSERIAKLAEQYQAESKQRRIDELTRHNERHELQQRWLWTVLGAIFVILVGTVYFLFHMRRANRMLATVNTSLERWHDMFEHAEWGVVIGGLDATLELINPAFAHMHGYTVEELTGRPIIDVYVPEKRESLLHEIELIHEKGHHSFESVHLRKDGTTFPVFVDATAVHDSSGNVLHRVVNIQDITDRKRLENNLRQSEQQFRSLAESSPDSIIRYDLEHRILYLNGKLVQYLGLGSADEVIGKRPIEVWPDGRYAMIDEAAVQAIKTGCTSEMEFSELTEDGKVLYHHISVVPERDAAGEIIGTIAFGREVTAIRETERNLHTLMENIPDLIARFDSNGRHLYVNPAIERAFGMPAECFIGKTEGELELHRPAEQSSELADGVRRAFAEGEINRTEAKWDLPEGERYFDVLHVPEKDENGNVISVLGIAHDISELKKMHEELYRREQMFRALAENSPNPIFRYDRNCRRLYVNPIVGKILGKPVAELVESTPADGAVLVSDENKKLMQAIRQVFASAETVHIDTDFIDRSGRHREYDMVLVPECDVKGEVNTVLGLAHDITAIRKTERRLTRFMVNVPGFVYTFRMSPEGRFSFPFASQGIQDLYGLRPEDVLDDMMPLHALAHPDDVPRIMDAINESARAMTPFGEEFRIQPPGRPERWLESRSVPERDADGGILWHGFMLDITERKMAEEALRESEEKYRTLIQNIQAAVVVHNADTEIITSNTAAQDILGLSEGQLHGKMAKDPTWQFFQEDGSPMPQEQYPVNIVLASGNPLRNYVAKVHRPNRANDVWVLINADPVFAKEGEISSVIVTFIDITERKEAEKQLFMMDIALNHVREAVYLMRGPEHIAYVNNETCRVLGYSRDELLNMTLFDIDPDAEPEELAAVNAAVVNQHYHIFERRHQTKDGRIFPVEILATVFEYDGQQMTIALARDITERKQQQAQEELRLSIFEQLAEGGGLPEILDLIAKYVEQQRPDFFINIMLVDDEDKHLVMLAAPRLPVNYSAALDGIAIAEGNGSCGTAAWSGKTVIAADIRTHPYWEAYKPLAVQAGLLACWSEPIHGSSGRVLGTFGVYLQQPGEPSDSDLETIRHASHLAAIAIERRQMEASLRKSEQDFRALAEHSPDYVSRYDSRCRRVYVNPTMQEIFGLPEDQILGKTPVELSPIPASREFMDILQEVLSSHREREWEFEFRVSESDLHWGHMRIVPEFDMDGNVANVLAIGRDFTELKNAEIKLEATQAELRELAAYREKAREDERKHIARELHDELGQMLSAIRMEVSLLKMQKDHTGKQFQDKMQSIVELVDRTIRSVRNVVVMLRPVALERGVVAALKWLVDEFSNQARISCSLNISDENLDIDEEHGIAIFRIVQESLTNVAKHSGASKVRVVLETKGEGYHLTIDDNGKGFDPAVQKDKSMGLIGIRERVFRLGGELKIDSQTNKGTTLDVTLPHRFSLHD